VQQYHVVVVKQNKTSVTLSNNFRLIASPHINFSDVDHSAYTQRASAIICDAF